ncbi:hypothetical protein T265_03096 [Opisthorchis viverrini]|uniref:Uncharacterized protein n=1 Tax=Opisthorchis viverrini TaxID=6198 RepID=A0A074ZX27_OPIVI|nr:hypothetical protein T265_03096 [Opisthorchis viverrini]KER30487.1 hypothetical protein T265_03096 [Opisthorchis viverrini]
MLVDIFEMDRYRKDYIPNGVFNTIGSDKSGSLGPTALCEETRNTYSIPGLSSGRDGFPGNAEETESDVGSQGNVHKRIIATGWNGKAENALGLYGALIGVRVSTGSLLPTAFTATTRNRYSVPLANEFAVSLSLEDWFPWQDEISVRKYRITTPPSINGITLKNEFSYDKCGKHTMWTFHENAFERFCSYASIDRIHGTHSERSCRATCVIAQAIRITELGPEGMIATYADNPLAVFWPVDFDAVLRRIGWVSTKSDCPTSVLQATENMYDLPTVNPLVTGIAMSGVVPTDLVERVDASRNSTTYSTTPSAPPSCSGASHSPASSRFTLPSGSDVIPETTSGLNRGACGAPGSASGRTLGFHVHWTVGFGLAANGTSMTVDAPALRMILSVNFSESFKSPASSRFTLPSGSDVIPETTSGLNREACGAPGSASGRSLGFHVHWTVGFGLAANGTSMTSPASSRFTLPSGSDVIPETTSGLNRGACGAPGSASGRTLGFHVHWTVGFGLAANGTSMTVDAPALRMILSVNFSESFSVGATNIRKDNGYWTVLDSLRRKFAAASQNQKLYSQRSIRFSGEYQEKFAAASQNQKLYSQRSIRFSGEYQESPASSRFTLPSGSDVIPETTSGLNRGACGAPGSASGRTLGFHVHWTVGFGLAANGTSMTVDAPALRTILSSPASSRFTLPSGSDVIPETTSGLNRGACGAPGSASGRSLGFHVHWTVGFGLAANGTSMTVDAPALRMILSVNFSESLRTGATGVQYNSNEGIV